MRTLNPDLIIKTVDDYAHQHFRNGDADQVSRLAYQVGLLNGKVRELCGLLNSSMEVLETTSNELQKLQIENDSKH